MYANVVLYIHWARDDIKGLWVVLWSLWQRPVEGRERVTETEGNRGDEVGGWEQTKDKSDSMKGTKTLKSVHKYRGPRPITTETGPLILTPAVPVTMDTSQLGPPSFLAPVSSWGLAEGIWPGAVIMGCQFHRAVPWRWGLLWICHTPQVGQSITAF